MIVQCMTTSFLLDLLRGEQNLDNDTFKLALYGPNADLTTSTVLYTPEGEVVSPNYDAGGKTLVNKGVTSAGYIAYAGFDDVVWEGPVTFNVNGGLIYNSTKGNRTVAVLNFGMTYQIANQTNWIVRFPPFTSTTAVIKLNSLLGV